MSAYWTLDNLVLVAENVFEQQKIWLSGGIQWLVAAAAPQHGCDELKLRKVRELATNFENVKAARFDNWDDNWHDYFMDESDRERWEYYEESGKILPKSQRVRSTRHESSELQLKAETIDKWDKWDAAEERFERWFNDERRREQRDRQEHERLIARLRLSEG